MNIAICDDDKLWHEHAAEIISKYADSVQIPIDVYHYYNGSGLLSEKRHTFDSIFMDIDLEDESGIELVKRINELWPECQVVYVTNYLYYATDVYATEHTFFTVKEEFGSRIEEIFPKILHAMEHKKEQLVFHLIGGTDIVLYPTEILYFERERRITKIITKNGVYQIWDKIADTIDYLPKMEFVRCHNSCIVYFPAVRELQKNSILMKDGTRIMVSRGYMKSTKEAFMRWALLQML